MSPLYRSWPQELVSFCLLFDEHAELIMLLLTLFVLELRSCVTLNAFGRLFAKALD